MFTWGSFRRGDVIDVIYDAEGAREGQYGCTLGLIWIHLRAVKGSHERAVMGLASRAASVVCYHVINSVTKSVNH